MSPIHLILGSHNSQALDLVNVDRDALYDHSYKPFLKLLYNHADIRFTMYYSGLLIEWLEKHHSEFVDVLTEMVKRKQIELLGGAYFEPLLPLIPKTDRIGQIERMTTHLRKCFGRRPRGAWIPESIWDQRIAANLSAGGMEYAFLRDSSFSFGDGSADRDAGMWPVLTEDQGKTLALFPLAWDLTARMFITSPEEVVAELRAIAENAKSRNHPAPVVSLLFDGSRLGHRAEETAASIAWYESFLSLVQTNRDWINVSMPNRIMRNGPPRERRYAPVSSLEDLTGWIAPLTTSAQSTSGDQWRSFRSIMELYPESGRLYAKMQHTHVLVGQVRGDKYRKMTAREELWRGQSHFAYWLNRTGGIYRSGLRKATYAALIEAEKSTRERGIFIPAISRVDVDLDGEEEILYQGNEINGYIDRVGAHLFELDYLPRNWNYLDTFQRRSEPFHDDAAVASGYDRWTRSAFMDHLLVPDHSLEDFAAGRHATLFDLPNLEYQIKELNKEHNAATFSGTCHAPDSFGELTIEKTFRFVRNRIDVEYELRNTGMAAVTAIFATEVNLSFHSLDVSKLRVHLKQRRSRRELPPDTLEADAISDLQFLDLHNSTVVTLNPSERPDLWSFPVEAVGLLWDQPHWFYQSNCAVLKWPISLEPGNTMSFSVSLRIEKAK